MSSQRYEPFVGNLVGKLPREESTRTDLVRPLLTEGEAELVGRIACAVEYREDPTGRHPQRVGSIAALLGEALGWKSQRTHLLEHAAQLHDIGKIAVSERILLKPDRLTAEEFDTLKDHTTLGAQMLAGSRLPVLVMGREIALSHHERWDGGGYPRGTEGDAISEVGRIVAIADVFDALTHHRPYRKAFPLETTLELLRRERGRQFDPRVVDALLEIVGAARLEDLEPPVVCEEVENPPGREVAAP